MITTVLLLLILVSIWIGFYQLVKQQGRMLLRLDKLERAASPVESEPESAETEVGTDKFLERISHHSNFQISRDSRLRSKVFEASVSCW